MICTGATIECYVHNRAYVLFSHTSKGDLPTQIEVAKRVRVWQIYLYLDLKAGKRVEWSRTGTRVIHSK